jgi:hypothetical protein
MITVYLKCRVMCPLVSATRKSNSIFKDRHDDAKIACNDHMCIIWSLMPKEVAMSKAAY